MCYHVVMERYDISSLLTPALVALREEFVARGFDLRLVGGCVRDFLYGTTPKDVDLCTDADPDEQISVYKDLGIRYIETGLQHGTVTAVLDGETYEITSLRMDAGNDGPYIMLEMHQMGISEHVDLLLELDYIDHSQNVHAITRNPITLMVALYHNYAVDILTKWKASGDEMKLAKWLSENRFSERSPFKYPAVDRVSRAWVMELAALRCMDGFDRGVLLEWEVPVFPVNGRDLIDLGYAQDKTIGLILNLLKETWAVNNYSMSKEELLDSLM